MRASQNFRAVAGAMTIAAALVAPSPARAQSAGDKVAAEALFEQGRSLVAEGKFADACPRFADSERLDPSPSTLLNLANCYEKLGRTATAWATYREAAGAANAAGRSDYVATATRHADALAAHLSDLTTTVVRPIDGLQVRRDGVDVTPATWGVPIPIDAGSHVLEATAPGYKSWSSTFEVAQDGAHVSMAVPALEAMPAEAPAPPAATAAAPSSVLSPAPASAKPDASTGRIQRSGAIIVAGLGIVGLGVSGVFAVLAKAQDNNSLLNCPRPPNGCTQEGVNQRNDALDDGNVATVAFGIGAAALAGGALLWFTAPSAPSSAKGVGVSPWIGARTGGALLQGAF